LTQSGPRAHRIAFQKAAVLGHRDVAKRERKSIVAQRPAVQGAEGMARFARTRRGLSRRLHLNIATRAFQSLRDGGMSEEEIAARHFVKPAIVKQRLRLASVSPQLHDVYADDGITLEQLMAFSVTADQARQEQVWDNLSRSQLDEPYQIRRVLTEHTVRASDRRAQFIGLEAYEQAGGTVMRDLFEHDDGGWLQDVPLLDRLVTEKLKADAEAIAAEGWKWIAVTGDAADRYL
jgi:ParB-like chromosome segregation protein Spo0J